MTLAADFLALHRPGTPLLMPNAWDIGSAKMFEDAGFGAIATTSSGFAATLGRLDGGVTADELFAHSASLVAAVSIPVSADMENGFGDSPEAVQAAVRRAIDIGLAGGSIEDFTGDRSTPIYDRSLAVERVAAAADVAGDAFVLTARCENLLHGVDDLDDTIARLQAYDEAGARVLFAPALKTLDAIERVIASVTKPVNVLPGAGAPPVAALASVGAARISVGGSLAWTAYAAARTAALELRDEGTYTWRPSSDAMNAVRNAFS